MPTPTMPVTAHSNALQPARAGVLLGSKSRGLYDSTYLFPTDGSVIDLPGAYNDQAISVSAQSAIFVVEQAAGSTAKVIARFWQDGKFPTIGAGLPVYDGSPVEILGQDNILNCRLISADGFAHTINVQYFS